MFFTHPGWRVERTARGEDARAWERALADFDADGAEVLKEDAGTAVYRSALLGRDVVLKRWDLATLGSRLKAVMRVAKADRHWRGATILARARIDTAACLALATESRKPSPRRWLVMEWVPGRSVLEHLAAADLGVRQEHALARALGRQIARFEGQAFNRDHKPSNLIVTGDADDPGIAVIDCVGVRRTAVIDQTEMLASLVIEPSGCDLAVRGALAMRVLKTFLGPNPVKPVPRGAPARAQSRAARNELWREVADLVRKHGDPRPRVNPLPPALHRR